MIRLLTDLGTDAPYRSCLRISRTVRYHSVGATRQGRLSPGPPRGLFPRGSPKENPFRLPRPLPSGKGSFAEGQGNSPAGPSPLSLSLCPGVPDELEGKKRSKTAIAPGWAAHFPLNFSNKWSVCRFRRFPAQFFARGRGTLCHGSNSFSSFSP